MRMTCLRLEDRVPNPIKGTLKREIDVKEIYKKEEYKQNVVLLLPRSDKSISVLP